MGLMATQSKLHWGVATGQKQSWINPLMTEGPVPHRITVTRVQFLQTWVLVSIPVADSPTMAHECAGPGGGGHT